MNAIEITVDMNQKCRRCGRKGATQCGLCLPCVAKEIKARAAAEARKPK